MRRRRRVLTGLLAVVLLALTVLVAAPSSAWAIGRDDCGSITMGGITEGSVTTEAYRIIDVSYDFDKDQPNDPEYMWASEVAGWVRTNYSTYIDESGAVTEAFSKISADEAASFYDALAAAIRSENVNLDPSATGTGSQSLTNLDMGTYLVLVENGMKVYRPSVASVVPSYDEGTWSITSPELVIKSSDISVDKTVSVVGPGVNALADEPGEDVATAGVGDWLQFNVVADVPDYPDNATNRHFVIKDDLSEGLTFMGNSYTGGYVSVVGYGNDSSETPLTKDVDYTATYDTRSRHLEVTITDAGWETIAENGIVKVSVIYQAKLNQSAVVGEAGNPNKVTLEYSNNPYSQSGYETTTDETTTYTFGIDVSKIDGSTHNPLSGATFEVRVKESSDPLYFLKRADGTYVLTEKQSPASGVYTQIDVDSEGKILFAGLKPGTYELTEVKAPGGYNRLTSPIEVTITASTDGDTGLVNGHVAGETENVGYVSTEVANNQGFTLPSTGGPGTVIFTVCGVALVVGGAFVALSRRVRSTTK